MVRNKEGKTMTYFWLLVGIAWNPIWTPTLNEQITYNLKNFDRASDVENYCTNYHKMTDDSKIKFWSRLAIDIAGFESGFDPSQKTYEPSLGVYSIGLFQLSKEDAWPWCDENHLTNPIINLKCAIPAMAQLVSQDGLIAQGHSLRTAKGLSHYWSTMWTTEHQAEIKNDLNNYCTALMLGEI